jgi:hypothetical protein
VNVLGRPYFVQNLEVLPEADIVLHGWNAVGRYDL